MDDKSVAICIYSYDRKQILLIKRRDVPVWVLPGGGIEIDEDPNEAAIRETKEETNYNIKIVKTIGEYTPANRLTRFTYLLEGSIISGQPQTSNETKDIQFFDIEKLPPMPPPYEDWIKDGATSKKDIIKKKLTQVTYLKLLKYFILHPILVSRFILARMGLPINS